MSLFIPAEIAERIAGYAYVDSIHQSQRNQRNVIGYEQASLYDRYASCRKVNLENLRLTSRVFRHAVDRLWFRELTINKISYISLHRLKKLLRSDSICSAIRTYNFTPQICLLRPIVKKSPWDYYGEYYDRGCHGEPRFTFLNAEHKMRKSVAEHYDEQLVLMGIDSVGLNWLLSRLGRLFSSKDPELAMSDLTKSLYFKGFVQMINLTHLTIEFGILRNYHETTIYYLTKNDTAVGFGRALVGSSPSLKSLHLRTATLCDIRNMVVSMINSSNAQGRPSKESLRELDVQLTEESLGHRGRTVSREDCVQAHSDGGESISTLLAIFPKLERLNLAYDRGSSNHLIVQDFHPQPLPYLRCLQLYGFAMRSEDLLRLTICNVQAQDMSLISFELAHVSLFRDGYSWAQVIRRWNDTRASHIYQNKAKRSVWNGYIMRNPINYLDLDSVENPFDTLSSVKHRVLSPITDEDAQVCELNGWLLRPGRREFGK